MRWLSKAFFSLLLILPLTPVFSEHQCVGKDCTSFERKYGGFLNSFEKDYLPILARDLFRAQATTQIATVPYPITLNKFTFGVSGTIAATETHQIGIYDPAQNQYKKMNEFGVAVNYNYYAGVNVGWLLTFWYSLYMDIFHCDFNFTKCNYNFEMPILSRIEIYVNGVGKTNSIKYNDIDLYYENRRQIGNRGYAIRYQVFQERRMFFDFLKLPGVSVGVGYQLTRIDFAKKLKDMKLGLQVEEFKYEWSGNNVLNYRADIETKYIDARTGIKILDFITLYGGAGASASSGGVFLSFYRNGTYIVANEPTNIIVKMRQNYYEDAYMQKYLVAGLSISGFTLQGVSTYGKHIPKNYAVTIGFSATF